MDHDQVYGPRRAERLIELLRALAARIDALAEDDKLLAAGPELMRIMGDARSELFHYEVRCTYDTPEVAESRRIVDEARRQIERFEIADETDIDFGEAGDDVPWQE